MPNVIQQINITCVPEQDRLLMKANVNGPPPRLMPPCTEAFPARPVAIGNSSVICYSSPLVLIRTAQASRKPRKNRADDMQE